MERVDFDDSSILQKDENEGLSFRKTPHPQGKQARSIFRSSTSDNVIAVAHDGSLSPKDTMALPATKRLFVEGSPTAATGFVTGDALAAKKRKIDDTLDSENGVPDDELTDAMEQPNKESDGAVDTEKQWNTTCELLLNEAEDSVHRQNAEILLKGMKDREKAQVSLESVFQSVSALLEEKVKKVLASAVPVHEKAYEKVAAAEQELLRHFGSNHAIRRSVLRALDKHNNSWQRLYEGFMARLSHNGDSNQVLPASLNQADDAQKDGDSGEKCDQDDLEPDWDALIEFDPSSRDKIQSFLDLRDQWNQACQQFVDHIDEIHDDLKKCVADLQQSVEHAYGCVSDFMDDQEAELQGKMVSNFKHRSQLDKALEEAVKQQQSMFSRLMARVSGSSTSSAKRSTGVGGLLAMNPLSYVFQGCTKSAQP